MVAATGVIPLFWPRWWRSFLIGIRNLWAGLVFIGPPNPTGRLCTWTPAAKTRAGSCGKDRSDLPSCPPLKNADDRHYVHRRQFAGRRFWALERRADQMVEKTDQPHGQFGKTS